MSSEKEFDLDEWIKQEKEIHFPAKRKPYNIAPDRAFELGLEWGFDKGQEQAGKRILEDCKKLATYVNNQLGAAYPAVSMEGIEDIIDKILKESK